MKSKWKKPRKTLTTKVAKIQKTLRTLKPELKNITNYHNASITSVGTMYPISNIAESYTSTSRVGLEIRGINVESILNVRIHNTTPNSIFRIIYFVDRQQVTDTYPTGDDLLHNKANATVSPMTEVHKGRFKILKDLTFALDPYNRQFQRKFKMKLDMPIRYNGSSSSDYQKNQVWMFVITDQVTYTPEFYVSNRFNYTDV